ncbi:MAG: hypothetical protein GX417_08150 [Clostridiales bacterium]|nr:hypothetical protein [Clostridiales bacterium]
MKISKRILLFAVVAMLAVFTVGCSFSFSTAKIEDAIMTNSIDDKGMPGEEVVSYTTDATVLYTSAKIRNAPDHTQIKIVWTYVTGDQMIDTVMLDSGTLSDNYISSNLELTTQLPTGDYKVEYYIDEREEPDAVVKFVVIPGQEAVKEEPATEAETAYLEDAHMTSYMDPGGTPADSITTVAPTGTWYVSAILRNTQPDTVIHFIWYDTNGNLIDQFDLDPNGETDIYISGSLELSTIAPEGQYSVELYVNDAATPGATVNFTVAAVSAEDAASVADFAYFSQTEGGFSIEYPSDWQAVDMKENYAAGFYPMDYITEGQEDINSVFVVVVKGGASGYTLDTALQSWIDETENGNLENYTYIDEGTDTVNGNGVAVFAYGWAKDGLNLYTMDYLVIKGDDLYVITFTATDQTFDTLYPFVERMVLTFQTI